MKQASQADASSKCCVGTFILDDGRALVDPGPCGESAVVVMKEKTVTVQGLLDRAHAGGLIVPALLSPVHRLRGTVGTEGHL